MATSDRLLSHDANTEHTEVRTCTLLNEMQIICKLDSRHILINFCGNQLISREVVVPCLSLPELAATPNPTDVRNPINELGYTPNPSDGSERSRKRLKVTPDVGGQCFRTHPHSIYKIHDYSTIAHSHTRTQRPQMTSKRVIWPLFFSTKQKKVHAYCMQYIQDAASLQSQVVKGRQLFRHRIHAHFTYRVGGKHCKRMASLYNMGNTLGLGGISPI